MRTIILPIAVVLLLKSPCLDAVICAATTKSNGTLMPNSTCSGANYCTAVWIRNSTMSPWAPNSQYCTQTSLSYSPYSAWILSDSYTARLQCSGPNFCNSASPPSVVPTAPPSPVPSTIECIQGVLGQNISSCMGSACFATYANGVITQQGCATNSLASSLLGVPSQKYCTTMIAGVILGRQLSSTLCVCQNSSNCNDMSLITWGTHQLNSTATTMCLAGSGNVTNPVISQYCTWFSTFSDGVLHSQAFGISSTLPLPMMGCTRTYGNANPSTACLCNTENCNAMNPSPTVWPTILPTVNPSNALNILLGRFDNTAGGGMLYNGGHCDPFWFSGWDQCDMAIKVCIEPSNADPSMAKCGGYNGWIDLGQVTKNLNIAVFAPGQSYGGWSDPMTFAGAPFQIYQGFRIKYTVQDIDIGGAQLIDRNSCTYSFSVEGMEGTATCQHVRPSGFLASLNFAYLAQFS